MAGKLQHTSLGIPNDKGLFSPIYNVLTGDPHSILITPTLKQALRDWATIIRTMSKRPTSVLELKPGDPHYIGYVDASTTGVGGVWLGGQDEIEPTVWRIQWPNTIQTKIIKVNRKGTISNSDLEMAGMLLAWLVLEQITPTTLKHKNIGLFCDNSPSVAWAIRLNSSKSQIVGHLLRALALRQHVHQSSPLLATSIAGNHNQMADIVSRSFYLPFFKNSNLCFIQNFNTMFPLPQHFYWKEYHLPEKYFSRVTSCLLGMPLEMALWTKIPGQDSSTGITGYPTQAASTKTNSSKTAHNNNKTSLSQLLLLGSGQATTAEVIKSKLRLLQTHFLPSQRPSNWLESPPLSTKHMRLTPHQWHGSWKGTEEMTLHQYPN